MKAKTPIFEIAIILSVCFVGCKQSSNDDPNERTPEQQKQYEEFFKPPPLTDRNKDKGIPLTPEPKSGGSK